jgi:hypothetical protein
VSYPGFLNARTSTTIKYLVRVAAAPTQGRVLKKTPKSGNALGERMPRLVSSPPVEFVSACLSRTDPELPGHAENEGFEHCDAGAGAESPQIPLQTTKGRAPMTDSTSLDRTATFNSQLRLAPRHPLLRQRSLCESEQPVDELSPPRHRRRPTISAGPAPSSSTSGGRAARSSSASNPVQTQLGLNERVRRFKELEQLR